MNKNKNYDGWELIFFDKAQNFRDYQWSLFRRYIKKNILEVGPGNCIFLKKYYRISKKIHLMEPSSKIRKKLKKKTKNLNKVKLLKDYGNAKYDTIIYLDVIEHIKDDKKEIFKAYKRLKKNGYLVISVPAFQYLYTDYDRKIGHHRRYDKSLFKIIFKKLKLKNYKMTYFDSIGYALILLSKYLAVSNKVNFQGSVKLWNFLIPISKILDIFLSPFIGKSLMVIIKKN